MQKNGIHYGDNDVPPYDLADSTRLAEAYRLVSAVASGGRPMFNVKLTPAEETRMAFAVADDRHAYHSTCPTGLVAHVPAEVQTCTKSAVSKFRGGVAMDRP